MRPRLHLALAAAASAALLAGCSGHTTTQPSAPTSSAAIKESPTDMRMTTAPWDRPTNQDELVEVAGLPLTPAETLDVHYHVHLDVLVDGAAVQVPAGLGINAGADGAMPAHGDPGIAPLHTHDPSGIVHIEAPRLMPITLGQLFTEWDVMLNDGILGAYARGDHEDHDVQVYVNGKRYVGNPGDIVLASHQEIAVVASRPGDKVDIPTSYDFPTGE